jgi:hypothetical protein
LVADPTMPSIPLSATARNNAPLNGLNSAVAPPPDVTGRTKGLVGSLQAGIVAPPVDARGVASDHSLKGPGAPNVVAPPPSLAGTSRTPGSLGAGSASVVAPPPSLASQGLRGAGPHGLTPGGAVVPPPPSIEHSGKAGTISGPGVAIVPPPPSMQGAGIGGGNGRGASSNGVGTVVVPPPPSVQSGTGGGLIATLSSWFSSSPPKIVPPPPGLQGEGGGRRRRRARGVRWREVARRLCLPPPLDARRWQRSWPRHVARFRWKRSCAPATFGAGRGRRIGRASRIWKWIVRHWRSGCAPAPIVVGVGIRTRNWSTRRRIVVGRRG